MAYFRIAFIFIFLFVSASSFAQTLPSNIQKAFSQFQREANLSNNQAAFFVTNSKTGETIFAHQTNSGMATASTLKVITSITAFDLLGSDFSYTTTLSYSGKIDQNGILRGDIIVRGSGDPTLGSDRYDAMKAQNILDHWTFAMKKLGIKQIDGRIIGDDRLFDGNQVPTGWPTADIGNYYGAGVSGLNWKENKAGITFAPGAVGSRTHISKWTDDVSYLSIKNEVTTGSPGSGDRVYGFSSPYATSILLKGTFGKDLKKTIEVSIPDPAFQLAHDLKANLEQEGIAVHGSAASAFQLQNYRDQPTQLITEHQSPKLPQIIHWFNHKSINLYGEALLKTIGNIKKSLRTTAESADYAKGYWKQTLNIPVSDLGTLDGSGLSPENRVTASAMNRIMQYATNRSWYKDFFESLPSINNMKMKSGTIGGVLAYSGYQTTRDGQQLTFTLFVNNYKGSTSAMRQRMFKLLNVLKQ
ncbi:D-alanyl-D-alanine carboxypeptidase/D-alanyl-D-alanine-endopeptidase [Sphingobacterium corticis]|uniref:D-alanyl-D-alanine carboxypeptidase/D-alanyl-D-alanine-endopeptidase n=1 Tax=Sphingobacterium corticis TaxID=1812823 RepID=A0ABW5NMN7_9SPHI